MLFPLTDKITDCEFRSTVKTLVTTSLNGNEQRAQVDTQRWQATVTLANLSNEDRRDLTFHIAEHKGALNAFSFELPGDLSTSSAGFTGTINVGGADAGDTSILLTATPSTDILKKGDLVKLPGANKTYVVKEDVTTNVGGAAAVDIDPPILEDSDAGVLDHSPVRLNMRYVGEDFAFVQDAQNFGTFTLRLIEVI